MSKGEFVVVVSFTTSQENHAAARDLIHRYIHSFLSIQPGFIESFLNENLEEGGLLHFARWQSEADFRAFADKAAVHPDLEEIRRFSPKPAFYFVSARYGDARDSE